jgi:hypothetical protein
MLELNWDPDQRTLRSFGFVALFAFGGLGTCALLDVGMFGMGLGSAREPIAYGLFGLSGLALASSVAHPSANRALYVATSLVAYPIGLLVSYAILVLLFFGIIAPIGFAMRLLGRDPLRRVLSPQQQSYWIDARGPRSKESYFRQF